MTLAPPTFPDDPDDPDERDILDQGRRPSRTPGADESLANRLARVPPEERKSILGALGIDEPTLVALIHTWEFNARPSQLPPSDHRPDPATAPTPWNYWMYSGGRGTGKTRAGAEWATARIKAHDTARTSPDHPAHAATNGPHRVGLAGRTGPDIRDIQIEGESGLLAVADYHGIPCRFQPSKRRVVWGSDLDNPIALATMYSSEEPDQARGPQHHTVWCDEVASWSDIQDSVGNTLWTNLAMGLRLTPNPRAMLTSTPKSVPLVIEMFRRGLDTRDHGVVLTFGSTLDNAANLAPAFLAEVYSRFAGTRLAAQELEGRLLTDLEGTLWSNALLAIAHEMADIATAIRKDAA